MTTGSPFHDRIARALGYRTDDPRMIAIAQGRPLPVGCRRCGVLLAVLPGPCPTCAAETASDPDLDRDRIVAATVGLPGLLPGLAARLGLPVWRFDIVEPGPPPAQNRWEHLPVVELRQRATELLPASAWSPSTGDTLTDAPTSAPSRPRGPHRCTPRNRQEVTVSERR